MIFCWDGKTVGSASVFSEERGIHSGKTYGHRRDVRKVGSNTGGVDDIVQGKFVNQGGCLQQKGERLFDND